MRTCVAAGLAWLAWSAAAHAADAVPGMPRPDAAHVAAASALMDDLRAESERHAAAIREAYDSEVRALALANRAELAAALERGSLLALPGALDSNVRPRLADRHPIGEADLGHQHLYVAARPETIGLLLDVASRVGSGPLDVTSMVRHADYQRRLSRTNTNARTSVPTHVMGLAFDVSILYTPLSRAVQIRDALREMAAQGDLYFVAERSQLVFHVVPAPARRRHYAALQQRAVDTAAASIPEPSTAAPVDAFLPAVPADPDPIPLSRLPAVAAAAGVGLLVLLASATPLLKEA